MRHLILVCFVLVGLRCEAAWTPNPGPFAVTNLGVSALGADHKEYLSILYTLSDGEPRVMYGLETDSPESGQIWDVGLSNSVSRVLTICGGSPPQKAHVLTSVDSLVLGTGEGTFVNCLWEYFPKTGVTNYIGECSGLQYYSGSLGSDGHALFGLYGYTTNATKVEEYDPITQTRTNWGKVNLTETNFCYVYWVGGDTNHIYAGIRYFSGSEAYLGVVEKATTNKYLFWQGTGLTMVEIHQSSTNVNLWFAKTSAGNWYELAGTNTPTLIGSEPDVISNHLIGGVNSNVDTDTWESDEGWVVDPTFAVVQIAGSTPQCALRWHKVGETNWSNLLETNGFTLGAYTIGLLVPYDASSLMWAAKNTAGPLGTMNASGDLTLAASQAGLKFYDLLVVGTNDVYLTGYHDVTKRWNPTATWTWETTSSDTDTNINPHVVELSQWGKYNFYMARAYNGKIFVGSHHERGTTGGELGWFDPTTYTTGDERTAFLSYDVADVTPANNASNIVYVSNSGTGGVFVWDVASGTITTNFSPIGSVALDEAIEYETGKLVGIAGTRTFAFTTSGTLLWTNVLAATPWTGISTYDHRITLGPDANVYQCAGGTLYRISPQDGTATSIATVTNDYNTVFLGSDLYLYGRTSILKIEDVVSIRKRLHAGKIRGYP